MSFLALSSVLAHGLQSKAGLSGAKIQVEGPSLIAEASEPRAARKPGQIPYTS